MASPHVAGVAARVLAANPDLPPSDVAGILRSTARDIGISGPDTYYGYGPVDPEAAVARALSTLRAYYSDFIVRLVGNIAHYDGRIMNDGTFRIDDLAGTYEIEVGDAATGTEGLGTPASSTPAVV